ncbi:BTB/POZ domain-containing protein [Ditylenchus destructor]|nr:BTB/POZ domain-containing protein [Ditylenchus destructor]
MRVLSNGTVARQLPPDNCHPRQLPPRQLPPRQLPPRQLPPRQLPPDNCHPRQLPPATTATPTTATPTTATPDNCHPQSTIMTEEGTLELRIDQFSKNPTDRISDVPTYIHGLAWKILANGCYGLNFYLECNGRDDAKDWKCRATVKFHIVSQKDGVDDIVSHIVHDFSKKSDLKNLQYMSREELLDPDNGFIKNDTVIVRVHVTAEMPQEVEKRKSYEFISSISVPPDGVLIVGDNKIPIHKTYLSFYSDFFKTLFCGKFKEGREDKIVLEEVEYEEMLELLSVIYPSNAPITDKNIKTILKLADRFIMPSVLERCKKELEISTNISGALKLFLAQRYNFTDLQIQLAQQYKTIEAVKKLKSEPAYKLLNNNTLALLFNGIEFE